MEAKDKEEAEGFKGWVSEFKSVYKKKQEEIKQKRAVTATVPSIPYAHYVAIRRQCFERCVRDMGSKVTDRHEESCLSECTHNIADVVNNFTRFSSTNIVLK